MALALVMEREREREGVRMSVALFTDLLLWTSATICDLCAFLLSAE